MKFGANVPAFLFAVVASTTLVGHAYAGGSSGLAIGAAAYSAGDFKLAAKELEPFARKQHPAALRMTGSILASGLAETLGISGDVNLGVRRLIAAARAGDTAALIRLEKLRVDGAPGAPMVDDLVEIERYRAYVLDDASSAWRVSQRYLAGETSTVSPTEFISMLKIAASKQGWPKAADAAFELCQVLSAGVDPDRSNDAEFWCDRASAHGHAGANLALIKFRTNDG